jgi:hypothetical protein
MGSGEKPIFELIIDMKTHERQHTHLNKPT